MQTFARSDRQIKRARFRHGQSVSHTHWYFSQKLSRPVLLSAVLFCVFDNGIQFYGATLYYTTTAAASAALS